MKNRPEATASNGAMIEVLMGGGMSNFKAITMPKSSAKILKHC
jgi:hypothetical protein